MAQITAETGMEGPSGHVSSTSSSSRDTADTTASASRPSLGCPEPAAGLGRRSRPSTDDSAPSRELQVKAQRGSAGPAQNLRGKALTSDLAHALSEGPRASQTPGAPLPRVTPRVSPGGRDPARGQQGGLQPFRRRLAPPDSPVRPELKGEEARPPGRTAPWPPPTPPR